MTKTFFVQNLGCRVNHYESEQVAALLRSHGYTQTDAPHANVRIINTCSVTNEAAAQSRQATRKLVRLPVVSDAITAVAAAPDPGASARVVAIGCWATSNPAEARSLPGVDAVITHQQDVLSELRHLLETWNKPFIQPPVDRSPAHGGQTTADRRIFPNKPTVRVEVKGIPQATSSQPREAAPDAGEDEAQSTPPVDMYQRSPQEGGQVRVGTTSLPLLDGRHSRHQRAFLKIQDGCDAHCTYCIIPKLRPGVWSKPIDDAVREARQLAASGHAELVLTGIFLGAYGQATALRRRQPELRRPPLADLVDALCAGVPGLRRLRLSSLEPGDLNAGLLSVLRSHPQVVPHFHLPLQSGSDELLRKMNRQYGRADYLEMVSQLKGAFDRPAITTDIIVGFAGETEARFEQTLDVAREAGFIHTHAFGYSPRAGTAAARWHPHPPPGGLVRERIARLTELARASSLRFRQSFIGQAAEILVEQTPRERPAIPGVDSAALRFGRTERYFGVWVDGATLRPGDVANVLIEDVHLDYTFGVGV